MLAAHRVLCNMAVLEFNSKSRRINRADYVALAPHLTQQQPLNAIAAGIGAFSYDRPFAGCSLSDFDFKTISTIEIKVPRVIPGYKNLATRKIVCIPERATPYMIGFFGLPRPNSTPHVLAAFCKSFFLLQRRQQSGSRMCTWSA